MKPKLSDILWVGIPIAMAIWAFWAFTRPFITSNGLPEWSIVRQNTNETFHGTNYGYVTESGMVIAGFKTMQDAIKERDTIRELIHQKTSNSPKPKGVWEVVK